MILESNLMFHILLSKCKQSETLSADLEPGGHERHGCQIKRNKKIHKIFVIIIVS